MRRPQRLQAARTWIASGARVTVKTYAKWFHVDKHCAYLELVALGVPIPEADRRWATPVSPRPRRRSESVLQVPQDVGAIPGWVFFGGEWIFAVDSTTAGFPIGLTLEQMNEIDPEPTPTRVGSPGVVE